jgi:hypothetical protein
VQVGATDLDEGAQKGLHRLRAGQGVRGLHEEGFDF